VAGDTPERTGSGSRAELEAMEAVEMLTAECRPVTGGISRTFRKKNGGGFSIPRNA
jgi:hypothetical protein